MSTRPPRSISTFRWPRLPPRWKSATRRRCCNRRPAMSARHSKKSSSRAIHWSSARRPGLPPGTWCDTLRRWSRLPEDVVCANAAEEDAGAGELPCDAVVVGHPHLPDPRGSFHLLDTQRGVRAVGDKQSESCLTAVLDFWGKPLEVLLETLGSKEHQPRRSFMSARTFWNFLTRPLRMSASASRSPACHSFVQK